MFRSLVATVDISVSLLSGIVVAGIGGLCGIALIAGQLDITPPWLVGTILAMMIFCGINTAARAVVITWRSTYVAWSRYRNNRRLRGWESITAAILLLPLLAGCGGKPSFMDNHELERYRIVETNPLSNGEFDLYMFPERISGSTTSLDEGYRVPSAYHHIWKGTLEGAVVDRPAGYKMWNPAKAVQVGNQRTSKFFLGHEDDNYVDRGQCVVKTETADKTVESTPQLAPVAQPAAQPPIANAPAPAPVANANPTAPPAKEQSNNKPKVTKAAEVDINVETNVPANPQTKLPSTD